MKETYDLAATYTLAYEGGKVDNADDPRTNMGVTQANYDNWRAAQGLQKIDVFDMSKKEAEAIYREDYADPIKYDRLPAGIDYAVFDFAINSGVSRAVRTLQSLVGASVDGVVGSQTIGKVMQVYGKDARQLIEDYCEERMSFLRRLSKFAHYGKGWTRRVEGATTGIQADDTGVVDRAWAMAQSATAPPPPVTHVPGKAWPEDTDPAQVRAALLDVASSLTSLAGHFE